MRQLFGLIWKREWRWIVAHVWDWLFPRSCWAETATWAMKYEDCRLRREAAGRGTPGYCLGDAHSRVGCWCGKFRPSGGPADARRHQG